MADKTKEELRRDKAIRIITMISSAEDMLHDLRQDVEDWKTNDEIDAMKSIKHQMHQNETVANLQFLIDYLQNKQRRS